MSAIFRTAAPPLVLAYHLRSAPSHIAFFCPWCRCVHTHGAAAGDGSRAAHCHEKSSSLFGAGVDLLFAGTVGSEIPEMTAAEMVGFSNSIRVGEGRSCWQPAIDAAGRPLARRRGRGC